MTDNNIQEIDDREQRDLAQRLAAASEVLDFDGALRIVRWRPAEAEKRIQMEEEMAKRQEERDRARERRRRALIEEFG
jgi:hypothetical protein